ncbi:transmembrane protein 68-like [Lacerta agilis]|uniref:transmembrane protein 68-like n=1 Tax=Lacerta agilis TaxID=80427 RepID=UPI0014194360|nr:transmembrane protein 68-like [Lacerta agilis]
MSWFIQILENWISVTYLEEFLNYVVHPRWLFLLPILIYSLWLYLYFVGCAISFLLFAYKKMNNHQETDFYSKFWDKARQFVALLVELLGKIWHGHEIVGMEHLPKGPGIVILHHPIIVAGYAFFVAKFYKETGRLFHTVIHHALYRVPGLNMFWDVIFLRDFKKAECVEILKKGHLLGITPGGALEANFSNDYTLMWNNRTGFARLALEAKVPIIPIFTQNSCEAYRTFGKTRLTKWLQKKFPGFLLPIYGGFPVKLRTYIGEPIPYDPNISATELAEKAKTALENLRDRHQKLPGNTLRALLERFDKQYKTNKSM